MDGAQFLKNKYDLHNSEEVVAAARRTHLQTGEKVSQKPVEMIQNYLERFSQINEIVDDEKKEKVLHKLKEILYRDFIIKPENIPESYFALQQRIAREQGHGDIEITEQARNDAVEVIQQDQRASLDQWVDYLASDDALYPDWTKYWVMRSVLALSHYDKEKKEFGKRSKDTTAPFPDLNHEALAYVVDVIEQKINGNAVKNPIEVGQNQYAEEGKKISDEEFEKILSTESFTKYYAFAIEHVTADNAELYKITEGTWKKYEQGSDDQTLFELTHSIQGHGTGWCTAGKSTAATQLEGGDFYVYYSNNAHGVPTIPRLAIRMQGTNIAEVRGVAHKQEIDPYISDVLDEKMNEFGKQGEKYKEKSAAMKRLTEICDKQESGTELTVKELEFIYEFQEPIQGFGYQKDPRIKEVRAKRDALLDLETICNVQGEKEVLRALAKRKAEHVIAHNISSFKSLDSLSADLLVSAGCVETVLRNLDKFSGIDETKLAKTVLRRGQAGVLASYLSKFSQLPNEIARELLTPDTLNGVYFNLQSFTGLDNTVLARLLRNIHQRGVSLILNNLDKFENIDSENLKQLLTHDNTMESIVSNIDCFDKKIHDDIVQATYRNGREYLLAKNLEKIQPIDQASLIEQLISTEHGAYIVGNIEKFTDINHQELLERLLETKYDHMAMANLEEFNNIDKNRLLQKLFELNKYDLIAVSIEEFPAVNKEEIIQRLLQNEDYEILAGTLSKFPNLNQMEVAKGLIKTSQGYKIFWYDNEFTNINYTELARELIGNRYGYIVASQLEQFRDVHHVDIAHQLIKAGDASSLAAHLDKFKYVDHTELMERILREPAEIENKESIKKHIQNFKGLPTELLEKIGLDSKQIEKYYETQSTTTV